MARTNTKLATPKTVAQSTPNVRPSITASMASSRRPTPDEIRKRAYELYLTRRGVNGTPEADWIQAERELTGEFSASR